MWIIDILKSKVSKYGVYRLIFWVIIVILLDSKRNTEFHQHIHIFSSILQSSLADPTNVNNLSSHLPHMISPMQL